MDITPTTSNAVSALKKKRKEKDQRRRRRQRKKLKIMAVQEARSEDEAGNATTGKSIAVELEEKLSMDPNDLKRRKKRHKKDEKEHDDIKTVEQDTNHGDISDRISVRCVHRNVMTRPQSPPDAQRGNKSVFSRPRYAFQVDDTDHCETPFDAYQDVLELLDQVAKSLGKNRSNLSIYDPYYCDGGVTKRLASLGFANVRNVNRDFYDDIANGLTPPYDILVTNPPYSGVHIEKLLHFCCDNRTKPFLLLMPHFVYTKDYYHKAFHDAKTNQTLVHPFFLVPKTRYAYVPPKWVDAHDGSKALARGKDNTAPFPTFWYCSTQSLLPQTWLTDRYGPSGMVRSPHRSGLRYAQSTNDIPRDFKGEFDVSKKRPNPKARKRAAKKRRLES